MILTTNSPPVPEESPMPPARAPSAIRWADEPTPGCCGGTELRCGCGNLLARVVGSEVELKCRRCKRLWRVPIAGARG
jgi:hypothetical protein